MNSLMIKTAALPGISLCVFIALSGGSLVIAEDAIPVQSELTDAEKQYFKARFKEDAASILKVVDRWAKAWADLDIDSYLDCYEESYHPEQYRSVASWRQARRERFQKQKWVRLNLTGMVLSLRGAGIYAVEFTQDYASDSYRDTTRKELVFRHSGGSWRIAAEQTVSK